MAYEQHVGIPKDPDESIPSSLGVCLLGAARLLKGMFRYSPVAQYSFLRNELALADSEDADCRDAEFFCGVPPDGRTIARQAGEYLLAQEEVSGPTPLQYGIASVAWLGRPGIAYRLEEPPRDLE